VKFDQVAGSLGKPERKIAQERLQWLALELGVRHDNEHVGTGLGGNNPQLVALMSFHHELVDNVNLTIEPIKGNMRWGYQWFTTTKKTNIRHELDAKLPVAKSATMDSILTDPQFSLGPNVATWQDLTYANRICAELASDLDKGVQTNISSVAKALIGFPMEIILLAVRIQIQIERLVRFNLDEHRDFGKLLTSVNRIVDA
jgi:hypothetical protein